MTDSPRAVAIIGIGNMGTPMASRLIEAGYPVHGYDLSAHARAAFATVGGVAFDSAAAAIANADFVILVLPSSDIVESVLLSPEVAEQLTAGITIIDMSSSEPLRTQSLATTLAERGVQLVDAPISGGVSGARAGTLTIMVGAPLAAMARLHTVLSPMGTIVRAGDVGAGHAAKALNNLLSATHLWATSEAMIAGERFGLDPEVLLSIFNGSSGRSGSTQNKWPNFILTQTFNSGFGLRLMLKDMTIATKLASQLGVPATLGNDSTALWSSAAADLAPTADHTQVATWIRSHPGHTASSSAESGGKRRIAGPSM